MTGDAGLTMAAALSVDVPPPSLLEAVPEHVASYDVDHGDRPDPLHHGFWLVGGVLAPLPPRVRLPHEDDEGEEVLA